MKERLARSWRGIIDKVVNGSKSDPVKPVPSKTSMYSPAHAVDVAVTAEEDGVEGGFLVLPHVAVAPHTLNDGFHEGRDVHLLAWYRLVCGTNDFRHFQHSQRHRNLEHCTAGV